ncbi:RusA family crossover junction endodeoxyribonuclease [Sandaracinus amylolyticus]|uniref:RusA family crossover junction endodeoxyribonuclease n=1 Tax=Sandaracinus amylolyticus TaxID=927083 RepID=UPI001F23EBEC|nr:RusA family crossover junction endodeoxyribonuclease [Sandaracinus amylolyticus]UJR81471.1 Hypothetical protein I5071_35300 [Sandaracinus amylolyticus]
MTELRYTLPGRPVTWKRARSKGSQRWTDPAMRAAQHAHALLVQSLVARMRTWPLEAHYTLEVVAYCAPVQRGDADNYAKLVADALQGVAYTNDRRLVDVRGRREIDAASPRTEVVLRVVECAR